MASAGAMSANGLGAAISQLAVISTAACSPCLQAAVLAAGLEALELPVGEALKARLARECALRARGAQRAAAAVGGALARQLARVARRLVPLGLRPHSARAPSLSRALRYEAELWP